MNLINTNDRELILLQHIERVQDDIEDFIDVVEETRGTRIRFEYDPLIDLGTWHFVPTHREFCIEYITENDAGDDQSYMTQGYYIPR